MQDLGKEKLSAKRQEILAFISSHLKDKGYPPSVREIGQAVKLASSSTVHSHLSILEKQGYIKRDPTKPRALELKYETDSNNIENRPVRHVPLVGEVAAGTNVLAQQNIEEFLPLPQDFTGNDPVFILKVRGDSMIEAGILDGDFLIVHQQSNAKKGDIVIAGIPEEEATVKFFEPKGDTVTLIPANHNLSPMTFKSEEVTIFGKVISLLRRI